MTQTQPEPRDRPTLLVIDDDPLVGRSFVRMLAQQGFNAIAKATGGEALDFIQQRPVVLALVDIHLPDFDGADLIHQIRALSPLTAIVAMTGQGDAETAFAVLREGASDYFEKPIRDWQRFNHAIRKNLELREKEVQIRALKQRVEQLNTLHSSGHFKNLIGNSEAMGNLKAMISTYGELSAPVLIQGDSGVGKERVARALHAASPVRDGVFFAVNCAAISRELIESELFGHEKGAFTGAHTDKKGYCEKAAGGTLFLDEIGELPLETQAKLLGVLERKEYRRVGGTQVYQLKARIIAATNVDLKAASEQKRFRSDLYFRLNVFEIHVPPLRIRKDDIPLLAYYFLQHFNQEFHRDVQRITPSALAMLRGQDYSANNVRELEHIIQRAVALAANRDEIDDALLDQTGLLTPTLSLVETTTDPPSYLPADLFTLPYQDAKAQLMDEFSQRYLEHQLARANHNITRAAELAGMARPNFSRLMKRFGIAISNQRRLKG